MPKVKTHGGNMPNETVVFVLRGKHHENNWHTFPIDHTINAIKQTRNHDEDTKKASRDKKALGKVLRIKKLNFSLYSGAIGTAVHSKKWKNAQDGTILAYKSSFIFFMLFSLSTIHINKSWHFNVLINHLGIGSIQKNSKTFLFDLLTISIVFWNS